MSRVTRVNLHEAVNTAAQYEHNPKGMQPGLTGGYGAELIEVFDPEAVGGPRTYFYCLYMGELNHPDLDGRDGLMSDVTILHKATGKFEVVPRGHGAEELVTTLEALAE